MPCFRFPVKQTRIGRSGVQAQEKRSHGHGIGVLVSAHGKNAPTDTERTVSVSGRRKNALTDTERALRVPGNMNYERGEGELSMNLHPKRVKTT